MRELTVRIRFTEVCLGNVRPANPGGNFVLPRAQGSVVFLASWHRANMDFAAQTFGRHQDEVRKIHWDIKVDVAAGKCKWYRRYYKSGGKARYVTHEAVFPDEVVGLNCVVPSSIPEDDFWSLMQLVGRYRGISPWRPGEFGFFDVVSIRPRRMSAAEADETPADENAIGQSGTA